VEVDRSRFLAALAAPAGIQAVVRDLAAAGLLVQAAAAKIGGLLRVHGFGLSVRDPEPA
jgi:hypothetical protein